MGTKEKANIKSGRNRENRNVNQENTERKWRENIVSITRNRDTMTTKNIQITACIVDTENDPMTNIVIMDTTIIKGIGMIIKVIGDLGSNGIDTQKNIRTYINMEGITAKVGI
jgi:hypothetical protein